MSLTGPTRDCGLEGLSGNLMLTVSGLGRSGLFISQMRELGLRGGSVLPKRQSQDRSPGLLAPKPGLSQDPTGSACECCGAILVEGSLRPRGCWAGRLSPAQKGTNALDLFLAALKSTRRKKVQCRIRDSFEVTHRVRD